MRYGIVLTAGDLRTQGDLAAAAEAAGWDGVFTWDGIAVGLDAWDPWVTMAVFALRTERVTLGAIVTPPARRRPWKLAREALSIDHLSGGRLVLPFGLGAPDDGAFGKVGEPTDRATRAGRLDETMDLLERFWSGEEVEFRGEHYRVDGMAIRPRPVNGRIPVWVVALWPKPKSMARAYRADGVLIAVSRPDVPYATPTPAELAEIAAAGRAARGPDAPWDIIVEGTTPADDPVAAATVRPLADAGATWWLESPWEAPSVEGLRARIAAGPPDESRSRGAEKMTSEHGGGEG